jgi:hypothetical protein
MKEYKVYELLNQEGKIVDVGITSRALNLRLIEHRCPLGRWPGRKDLTIQLYAIYNTKKEALATEGAHKLELGMKWTELESRKHWAIAGGKSKKRIENYKQTRSKFKRGDSNT